MEPVFGYESIYVDVHEVPDASDHFEVSRLPALVLNKVVHQAVRSEQETKALLASNFSAALPTDGDF